MQTDCYVKSIDWNGPARFRALHMASGKRFFMVIFMLAALFLMACSSVPRVPDLGGLYNDLAQSEDPYRNPVILIPGILGSKLVEQNSGIVAWGTFGIAKVNPNTPSGARLIALPMQKGQKLSELKDTIVPLGTLDKVVVNFGGYPIEQNTYAYILGVLGVGGYRDQQVSEAGLVDWGDRHFTCFQFPYDWRRDIVESAKVLDGFIREKKKYVEQEINRRFGIKDHDVKFDIVTHSMGGLVARYYLRYGAQDLPGDGSLPKLTWAGSRYVNKVVMVGPPNGGSLDALFKLVNGYKPAFLLPRYAPAVIGTMPSLYQLLPRNRYRPLLDKQGRPVDDIFDPELWRQNAWGLADPKQDKVFERLLPDVHSPEERRQIAFDHLVKNLHRARQFSAALDIPAKPPDTLNYFLVAGDAEETGKTAHISPNGNLSVLERGLGDGTVLRRSALMDERLLENRSSRLISPIPWTQVYFLFSNHRDITKAPEFTDNLLYILLESPRNY